MTYSIEESALISGLIVEYFSRASVSEPLRLAYRQVHRHLMDNHLTQDDLKRIQAVLVCVVPTMDLQKLNFEKWLKQIAVRPCSDQL